jgi:hypothetical protein
MTDEEGEDPPQKTGVFDEPFEGQDESPESGGKL